MSATPPPVSYLNVAKLVACIGTIVEQPHFGAGLGGLPSTERDSFPEARALLILTAFQLYPLLVDPESPFRGCTLTSLRESNPQDGTTGVANELAVKVVPDGSEGNRRVMMSIPLRSKEHINKVLEPNLVLRNLFIALAQWAVLMRSPCAAGVIGQKPTLTLAATLQAQWMAKFSTSVPSSVHALIFMDVIPHGFVKEYNDLLLTVHRAHRGGGQGVLELDFDGGGDGGGGGEVARDAVSAEGEAEGEAGGGAGVTGGARTGNHLLLTGSRVVSGVSSPRVGGTLGGEAAAAAARGSAVGLWWPPIQGKATTFASMMRLKEHVCALKAEALVVEKEVAREQRAAAATARIAASKAGGR